MPAAACGDFSHEVLSGSTSILREKSLGRFRARDFRRLYAVRTARSIPQVALRSRRRIVRTASALQRNRNKVGRYIAARV